MVDSSCSSIVDYIMVNVSVKAQFVKRSLWECVTLKRGSGVSRTGRNPDVKVLDFYWRICF